MQSEEKSAQTSAMGSVDAATAARSPASPALGVARGARLGRYVVLHALGSGGGGNVYAAYDPELDRKVAVKLLSVEALRSPGAATAEARLRREARAAARLAHPNVVRIYDVGRRADHLFVAMELIEGRTLRDWLAERPRAWRQIVQTFLEAGRGLAAAHAAHVVHRDFKPNNVMVCRDGRVLLVDFGLARFWGKMNPTGSPAGPAAPAEPALDASAPEASRLTRGAVGTPGYMSPEQERGELADPRADQYAFCVALAEALSQRHGERRPAGGPPRLQRALLRGTAAEPRDRYASFEELLERLEAALRPRRRLLVAAAAVVVAALAASTAWWATAGSSVCEGAERHLAGVWDAGVRSAAQRAFLAADLGFAATSWLRASGRLDELTGRWVRSHRAACEATHVRGEQSEHLLDLRMDCLQDRLAGIGSVGALFAAADAAIVREAPRLASALGDPRECDDTARLIRSPALPPPAIEDAVRAVRRDLVEAKVQGSAGHLDRALELAWHADRVTERTGFEPLVAEASFRLGTLLGRAGDRQGQKEALLSSLQHAMATGHDEYAARAAVDLIVAAVMRGEPDEAAAWATVAEGAIERYHDDVALTARRLMFSGMLSQLRGDAGSAIRSYEAALAAVPHPDPIDHGSARINTGIAYLRMGRQDEAEGHLLRGLDLLAEGYGPDHPEIATALMPLGELELERGQPERAYATFGRARALADGGTGADDRAHAAALAGQGRASLELGRPAEAMAALEQATERFEQSGGNPSQLASWRFALARAVWEDGRDPARALDLARRAHDALRAAPPGWQNDLRRLERWLAEREAAS